MRHTAHHTATAIGGYPAPTQLLYLFNIQCRGNRTSLKPKRHTRWLKTGHGKPFLRSIGHLRRRDCPRPGFSVSDTLSNTRQTNWVGADAPTAVAVNASIHQWLHYISLCSSPCARTAPTPLHPRRYSHALPSQESIAPQYAIASATYRAWSHRKSIAVRVSNSRAHLSRKIRSQALPTARHKTPST